MNYSSIDLSKFELENADPAKVVQALVNADGKNRSERRKIIKSLGKYHNREKYYSKQLQAENVAIRKEYQQELDKRINEARDNVHDGLIDNWKRSTALVGLVLKRKYNWSNGRIGSLIEKANELHVEMVRSGEWEHILELLDEECDITLECED